MRLSLGLLAVVAMGCATQSGSAPVAEVPSATAPPMSKTQSATDLEEGLRLFADRQYIEAAEAFERAYQRGGSTPALFAEGQSLQLAGECARALEVFERLLLVEPDPTYAHVVHDLMAGCE